MATKKKSTGRKSSGSGTKSKKVVRKKMQKTMREYKHHELKSGRGGKVKSRKQAIAIGLSEARRAGANVPRKKKAAKKRSSSSSRKKSTAKKSTSGGSRTKKSSK